MNLHGTDTNTACTIAVRFRIAYLEFVISILKPFILINEFDRASIGIISLLCQKAIIESINYTLNWFKHVAVGNKGIIDWILKREIDRQSIWIQFVFAVFLLFNRVWDGKKEHFISTV